MQQEMHANECKNSGRHVIQDDPSTLGKSLQLPYGRRLEDIEGSKKYKTRKESFPCQRNSDQCDELPGYFINHHELGIFYRGRTSYTGRSRDAYYRDRNRERTGQRSPQGWRGEVCNCGPK